MKRCLIFMLLLGLLLTGCRKQTQPEQLPTAETIDTQANTEPAAQTPEQTLTLGMIDFDAEKSVLRSMIQSYNFSGAKVKIEIRAGQIDGFQKILNCLAVVDPEPIPNLPHGNLQTPYHVAVFPQQRPGVVIVGIFGHICCGQLILRHCRSLLSAES